MSLCDILGDKTFIIAEIGQNHQGDMETAKKLIRAAKECGADCAKFQKTNLTAKFTQAVLNRPYQSVNSFGDTYGEHKAFLEFSEEEFKALQVYAYKVGIQFTASAMDIKSLEFLVEIGVPFVKIGSGDGNNFLLIEEAAKKSIPLVISTVLKHGICLNFFPEHTTGMQSFETVKKIYNTVSKYHKDFALLHCISAYPTPFEDINLKVLNLYQQEFPDIDIGYSGHEFGIDICSAAVALGSKIIERHITLDKHQKGTDHNCSLEPQEFKQLVTNIRNLEKSLGQPVKKIQPSEMACYQKLGKTIVYSKHLSKGHTLAYGDLDIKVAEPGGINGSEIHSIYGKILNTNVEKDESLQSNHLL